MPSLIDIRRRIRAVKSTQQITKAMKMVAASRMRRAHDRIVSARPFSRGMLRILHSVASRVDPSTHPLLAVRDDREPAARILLIVVTGDKGLAGSFNSNVIKAAAAFIGDRPSQAVDVLLVGRKGRDFFRRRGYKPRGEHVGLFPHVTARHAADVARPAIEAFSTGLLEAVYVVYNEFKSIMTQRVVVERLLPIPRLEPEAGAAASTVDYIFEPAPEQIFADLLPRHVQVQVYRALLESNAAFFAAQMTAMDAATRNSAEMIENLTLYMNKVRQAAITREIIEVVSGAAAT